MAGLQVRGKNSDIHVKIVDKGPAEKVFLMNHVVINTIKMSSFGLCSNLN
jgi:hypothetical protein